MAEATSGMGGGLRYVTEEPTPDMVTQGLRYSCVVACVRQLLRNVGVTVSEAELIDRIGVVDGLGSTPGPAAAILSALHPRLRYEGGAVDPDTAMPVLFRRDAWVAFVGTDHGSVHSVIVDRLE
jgi:hypothetical protein